MTHKKHDEKAAENGEGLRNRVNISDNKPELEHTPKKINVPNLRCFIIVGVT